MKKRQRKLFFAVMIAIIFLFISLAFAFLNFKSVGYSIFEHGGSEIGISNIINKFFSNIFEYLISSSADEIMSDPNIVLLMHMNGDASDSSGNGNHGTAMGGANCNVAGKFGNACEFDGVDDLIRIGHSQSLAIGGANPLTMSAWIYPTETMDWYEGIIDKSYFDSYLLSAGTDNGKINSIGFYTNGDRLASTANSIPLNQWTHVAATFDGATKRAYINGVEVASKQISGIGPGNTAPLQIGANYHGDEFKGVIDEVVIFKKALTPAEILELYNAAPSQPQTCVENWQCANWSACINGTQNRTCIDLNNCGTTNSKPPLIQPCNVTDVTGAGECVESWSCGQWSECVVIDGRQKQIRECIELNNCITLDDVIENAPEVERECAIIESLEETPAESVESLDIVQKQEPKPECKFTRVDWTDEDGSKITKVKDSETVYLTVESENCGEGNEVVFTIYETDGILGREEKTRYVDKIGGGKIKLRTKASWEKDNILKFLDGGNPEFVFVAKTNPSGTSGVLVVEPAEVGLSPPTGAGGLDNPWVPPIGIPRPEFGIEETYRMYDDDSPSGPRNLALTYTQNAEGGFYTHYVDNSAANCVDGSNNGMPATPRCTIPYNLVEGSVVEIHGRYNVGHGSPNTIVSAGTVSSPIFIRGKSNLEKPFMTQPWEVTGMYVVFENLEFGDADGNLAGGDTGKITIVSNLPGGLVSPSRYIAFRNNDVHGNLLGGGVAVGSSNEAWNEDIVIYNNVVHDAGDYQSPVDADVGGMVAGYHSRRIWFVDNKCYQNGAPCVFINGGSGFFPNNDHIQFIYVGRNTAWRNREANFWTKQANHVVFSENTAYDSFDNRPGMPASCMGFQYGPSDVWFLFNKITGGCGFGIAIQSNSQPNYGPSVYFIGNEISNIGEDADPEIELFEPNSAWSQTAIRIAGGGPNLYVIGNTIYNSIAGIQGPHEGNWYITNNIISEITHPLSNHVFIEDTGGGTVWDVTNSLLYDSNGPAMVRWRGTRYTVEQLQTQLGKGVGTRDASPQFINAAQNDFHLQAGSPARNAGDNALINDLAATYEQLYGVSIRYDLDRVMRPQENVWDIGAYEFVNGTQPPPICTNGQTRACPLQLGVCAGSIETCTSQNWPGCSAVNYGVNYESGREVSCSDGLDNDCDGLIDSLDPDCIVTPGNMIYVDLQITPTSCTTYNVATRSCTGGTATAYKTIAGAVAVTQPGDTVSLLGGTYNEQLSPSRSGTAGNYITYKNYGTERVMITGVSRAIDISNKQYLIIDGLNIDNTQWLEMVDSSNIILQNNRFTRSTASGTTGNIRLIRSDYNKILNNHIEDGNDNVVFSDSDYNLLEGNNITTGRHTVWNIRCGNFNIVRGNYFKNPSQKIGEVYDCEGSSSADPIKLNATKHNIVENNIFAGTLGSTRTYDYNAIQYSGQEGIVRNNVFYDNFGGGLHFQVYPNEALYNSQHRVYHNTFYENRCYGIAASSAVNPSQYFDNIVKNNVLYRNFDCGAGGEQTSIGNPTAVAMVSNSIVSSDPGFVNAAGHNFNLLSSSSLINQAEFLSFTSSSGSGTQMQVADAGYFTDGFGIAEGDLIQLQGQTQTARITGINYAINTLTLDRALTWTNGQGVSLVYSGNAPDMGAYEFVNGTQPPTPVCDLTSASWSAANVTNGTLVEMIVTGDNCNGEQLNFTIWEDDGLLGRDYVTSMIGTFDRTGWIAEWRPDQLGDPEFYFDAFVVSNNSESERSGLLAVSRGVSQNQTNQTNGTGDWVPPIGIPRPEFGIEEVAPALPNPWNSEVPGFYYVEQGGTNTGYGHPGNPRNSIPYSLAAGSVVILDGVYNVNHADANRITANGTPTNPVFIRGTSDSVRPIIKQKWSVTGRYYILEYLKAEWDNDSYNGKLMVEGDHGVLRHSDLRGDTGNAGTGMWGIGGVIPVGTFHVIWDNYIHHAGDVNANFDQDSQCIAVGDGTNNMWVVDNELAWCSGDGIQLSGYGYPPNPPLIHHIYIGRNNAHHNKQAGIGLKYVSDIVISQNDAHHHFGSNSSPPGQQIGMQYGPQRIWAIFNELHDGRTGFGLFSSNGPGGEVYFIGNLIHDLNDDSLPNVNNPWHHGTAFLMWGNGPKYLLGNTIYKTEGGVGYPNNSPIFILNNIFSNMLEENHFLNLETPSLFEVHNNIFYGPGSFRYGTSMGNIYTLASFQSAFPLNVYGNSDQNPQFVNAVGNDFHLTSGSPARNAGDNALINDLATTYEQLYGVSIRYDLDRVMRPQENVWDIGAYEFVNGTLPPPTAVCGNGIPETGEECDNGARNGVACVPGYGNSCNYCSLTCTTQTIPPQEYCGDLIVNGPEVCEPPGSSQSCSLGGYSGTQQCANNCLSWGVCSILEFCGDGAIQSAAGEECDDNNIVSGDGCSSICQREPGWTCAQQPSICNICELSLPSWSSATARQGELLQLRVQGNNCEGLDIDFRVWEQDLLVNNPARVQPNSVTMSSNRSATGWQAESGDPIGDSEYFFIARVNELQTISTQSGIVIVSRSEIPSVVITSPMQNENLIETDVEVDFSMQNWQVLGINREHAHFYLNDDTTPYMFYNGVSNVVHYNGAPSARATRIDSDTIRFNNLAEGGHNVKIILADEFHVELINPEATYAVRFTVNSSMPTTCTSNAQCLLGYSCIPGHPQGNIRGCVLDSDGDGVPDAEDNCPFNFNTNQADYDLDGRGDVCDYDADNDLFPREHDCNDLNENVNPAALEICSDGIDNDCDGLIDLADPYCALPVCSTVTTCTNYPTQNECNANVCGLPCYWNSNVNSCENLINRDSDGDGVPDIRDRCYNPDHRPPEYAVTDFGCPYRASFNNIVLEYPTSLANVYLTSIDRLRFRDVNSYVKVRFLMNVSLVRNITNGTSARHEPLNLDDVQISRNKIELNPTLLPGLNERARLEFFNVEFSNPILMRDGVECTNCITSFDSTTKIFSAEVPGFSSYEVVEQTTPPGPPGPGGGGGGGGGSRTTRSPQCADSIDNDNDGLIDYPADSGCSSNTDDSEANIVNIIGECFPDWQCSEWSSCTDDVRTRNCNDLNNCGTNEGKLSESEECTALTKITEGLKERTKINPAVFIAVVLLVGIIITTVVLIRRARRRKRAVEVLSAGD